MKHAARLAIFLLICSFSADAQDKKTEQKIRKYWFVMLVAGKDRSHDSATAVKIQAGHMANITNLYNQGKLKVAGPFGDDGIWRGIFIFDCEEQSEVEKL